MTRARLTDIGSAIKMAIGTPPLADTGSTVNGAAIDRMPAGSAEGYDSCVLYAQAGAATGSPSPQTFNAKLQESADGSTGWTDIVGAAVDEIATDDGEEFVDVDLSGVEQFIRVVRVVVLTGGSSPTWPVATPVVLGGAHKRPAA